MELGGRHRGGAGVPVEGGDGAELAGVPLQAVPVWGHHVPTLELGHLDLPAPGGGGGPGVHVYVDGVAAVRGGDEHVLASVIPADDWWTVSTRIRHCKRVVKTITHTDTIIRGGSRGVGRRQYHGVEVQPYLAHLRVTLADSVQARISISADGEGGDDEVGVVLAAGVPARQAEHAAHAK